MKSNRPEKPGRLSLRSGSVGPTPKVRQRQSENLTPLNVVDVAGKFEGRFYSDSWADPECYEKNRNFYSNVLKKHANNLLKSIEFKDDHATIANCLLVIFTAARILAVMRVSKSFFALFTLILQMQESELRGTRFRFLNKKIDAILEKHGESRRTVEDTEGDSSSA